MLSDGSLLNARGVTTVAPPTLTRFAMTPHAFADARADLIMRFIEFEQPRHFLILRYLQLFGISSRMLKNHIGHQVGMHAL
jgi:hypothetical protein